MSLSEQEEQRRKSREEIIDLGIDPYPSETFDINTNSCLLYTSPSPRDS